MKVTTPAAEVPATSQATPGACYSLPARGKADKSSPAAVASQPLLGLLRPSGIGWRESHPASVAAVSESFPAAARAYVRASPDCLEPKRLASSEGVPVFSGGTPFYRISSRALYGQTSIHSLGLLPFRNFDRGIFFAFEGACGLAHSCPNHYQAGGLQGTTRPRALPHHRTRLRAHVAAPVIFACSWGKFSACRMACGLTHDG